MSCRFQCCRFQYFIKYIEYSKVGPLTVIIGNLRSELTVFLSVPLVSLGEGWGGSTWFPGRGGPRGAVCFSAGILHEANKPNQVHCPLIFHIVLLLVLNNISFPSVLLLGNQRGVHMAVQQGPCTVAPCILGEVRELLD